MVGTSIPSGYVEIDVGGKYVASNGPLYAAWQDGKLLVGIRIEERHCNPSGVCHGGMLSTFADMMMPYAAMYALQQPRRFTPTISLHTDFVAPAKCGTWLVGTVERVRSGRALLFVQGAAWADGGTVMHTSGVYKWGQAVDVPDARDPCDPFGVILHPS